MIGSVEAVAGCTQVACDLEFCFHRYFAGNFAETEAVLAAESD